MELKAKLTALAGLHFKTSGIGVSPLTHKSSSSAGTPVKIDLSANPETWLAGRKDGIYQLDVENPAHPELTTLFIARAGKYTSVALTQDEVKSDLGVRNVSVLTAKEPLVVITDTLRACIKKVLPALTI